MFSIGRALVCFHFCFSLSNKIGTRISVREISQAWQTYIRDLPPTRCTNIEQSNMQGQTDSSREDWFSETISDSPELLLQWWFVQHYPQLPPNLSLNKHKSWSLKLNSLHPCYLLLMNNAPMHHTSSNFFWKVTCS